MPCSLCGWFSALFVLNVAFSASAAIYYVDSSNGSDSNSGTATNAAWQSLAKVNSHTFSPGDSILFAAGRVWAGTTQLHPLGSGVTNNPIVIDRYGSGPKPIINAGAAVSNGAVYLSNQSFWEIDNLEITSDAASDEDRRGVYFQASTGAINHLYLRNCYIHNIRGTFSTADGSSTSPQKRTGGMIVENTGSASFNDILIEYNEIQTVRNIGLVACLNAISARNVIVRGNTIHDVSKNAMIIRVCDNTCLIEHNLCYDTATLTTGNTIFTANVDGPMFQFNEGYNNRAGDHDGSLYDADLNSRNVIFQYSYSHDNSHGLFWQYAASPSDAGIIVRYNISQNDQGNIFSFSGNGGGVTVYNNTIYIPATNKPPTNLPRYIIDERSSGHTETFYNNVIYNLSPEAQYHFTSGNTRTFDYNVFYGQHPASEPTDTHKLTSDPRFVAPGAGQTNNFASLTGYKLQAASPCIDSGVAVANNGGLDFFGEPVPVNSAIDRGAHEWRPAPIITPPLLQAVLVPSNGQIQISFTSTPALSFTLLKATNLSLSATSWVSVGTLTEASPGEYQTAITPEPVRVQFLRVRQP